MTPATAVRDLEPADAEARDAIVASLPYHFAVETGVRACAAAVRAGPGLVAVEAGIVAGFLTWRAWYETAREITWMAVAADRRGHGIGRALIDRLAADSQGHARHLVVTTLSASTPEPGVADGYECTRRFYRRNGFDPVWEPQGWWDDENQAVLVLRVLE